MSEDERREGSEKSEPRFPEVPGTPDVPEAPKLAPVTRPARPKAGPALEPGSINKSALAATAASSFIMPIIILAVLGYFIDQKLHHSTYYLALIGLLVGLVVGVSSLLKIVNKLSK